MHIVQLKWRFCRGNRKSYFLKNKQTYDFIEYTVHLKTHYATYGKKMSEIDF